MNEDIIARTRLEIQQQKELMDASGGDLIGYIEVFSRSPESQARAMEFAQSMYDADYERLSCLESRLTLLLTRKYI